MEGPDAIAACVEKMRRRRGDADSGIRNSNHRQMARPRVAPSAAIWTCGQSPPSVFRQDEKRSLRRFRVPQGVPLQAAANRPESRAFTGQTFG